MVLSHSMEFTLTKDKTIMCKVILNQTERGGPTSQQLGPACCIDCGPWAAHHTPFGLPGSLQCTAPPPPPTIMGAVRAFIITSTKQAPLLPHR